MAEECFEDLDPFNCPICLDALQIQWRFPADTTTAWVVLKTTGIKVAAKTRVTVALRAGRPSRLDRSSTKTPCLQKWWSGLKTQAFRIFCYDDLDTRREKSAQQNKVSKCVQKVRICSAGPTWRTVTIAIPEKSTVVAASREPKGNIFLQHNRLLEISCCTDQRFICPLCLNETHQGHMKRFHWHLWRRKH